MRPATCSCTTCGEDVLVLLCFMRTYISYVGCGRRHGARLKSSAHQLGMLRSASNMRPRCAHLDLADDAVVLIALLLLEHERRDRLQLLL